MTIPAIAPRDKPSLLAGAAVGAAEVLLDDGDDDVDVGVDVGKVVVRLIRPVIVGNTTLAHNCSAPEL